MSDVGLGCIVISFIRCFKGSTFLQNHVDFPSKLFNRQHQYDGAESGSYFDRTQEGNKKKKRVHLNSNLDLSWPSKSKSIDLFNDQ